MGAAAGAAFLATRGASACGLWVLHDQALGANLRHLQGSVDLDLLAALEGKRFARRELYRLRGGVQGYAWFKPTRRRLFEIVDDTLLMYGETVGAVTYRGVTVGDVNYEFEIVSSLQKHRFNLSVVADGTEVARAEDALDFVCGKGHGIRRRLVFHAMWRELVWPQLRQALIDGK